MSSPKRLCLNMIVRNEMANLPRCLSAVAPYVSAWVIGDTGSTDGTPAFIARFFAERGIPGEVHSFAFVDFGQARNAALQHAYDSALAFDYLLLTDADMELAVEDQDFRARLDAPCYAVLQRGRSLSYWNARILRRDVRAFYRGVTHEYLELPGHGGGEPLEGLWFVDHATGANRSDKTERDLRLLTMGLEAEPDNARYWFYFAQALSDAGRAGEAAEAYARRAEMGGWAEEAWHARLSQARCLRTLGDEAGFVRQALAAYEMRPHRAEPLYDLAQFHRLKGMNNAAVLFAEAGLAIPRPRRDLLFIEDRVYQSGLREEFSIAAYYTEAPALRRRGFAMCDGLALDREASDAPREQARRNLRFYAPPLAELAPSFAARPVDYAPPPGWTPLNPSIARVGEAVMMVQRTVNYVLDDAGRYHTPQGEPITTRNMLLTLGGDLGVVSAAEILPPADMPPPRFPAVRGFEDMRLFAWRGALWCVSTVRELTPEGWCQPVLARIAPSPDGAWRLADWRPLGPIPPVRHEKNWMPMVDGERLRFVYGCDPTRIVDDEGRTLAVSIPAIAADAFRGGGQAVAFDGGWLLLVHEAPAGDYAARSYQHRFVALGADGTLGAASPPFYFNEAGVEFAAGLAWAPDGRLLVSYGVRDRQSWVATLEADEVRALLSGRSAA